MRSRASTSRAVRRGVAVTTTTRSSAAAAVAVASAARADLGPGAAGHDRDRRTCPEEAGGLGRRGVVCERLLSAGGECCHYDFWRSRRAAAAVAGVERDMRDE